MITYKLTDYHRDLIRDQFGETSREYLACCGVSLLQVTGECQTTVNNIYASYPDDITTEAILGDHDLDMAILDRDLSENLLELFEIQYNIRVHRGF